MILDNSDRSFLLFPRWEEIWNNNFSCPFQKNQVLRSWNVVYWGADPWYGNGMWTFFLSSWLCLCSGPQCSSEGNWEEGNSGIPTVGFPWIPQSTTLKSKVKGDAQTTVHWILKVPLDNPLDATGPGYVNISLWLYRKQTSFQLLRWLYPPHCWFLGEESLVNDKL